MNMKKSIHIKIVFCFFLFFNSYIIAQWQSIQTTFNTTFIDVSVVNSDIIWACGSSPQLSIVRTTNGGANWTNTLSGSLITHVWHTSAIDENHAWVTGGLYDKYVFATTNGGLNWVQQIYSPIEFINFIHFFNATTGIFLTDKVNDTIGFFITRNGGNNWYRSANSPRITTIINDNCMGFLDSNLLWFIDDNYLYKLTGGLDNSWTSSILGFYPYNVDFKDSNTSFATDGYILKKTTDGGLTWQLLTDSVLGQNSNSLSIIPYSNMVVVTGTNRSRVSYDLCSSWQNIQYFNHGYYIDAMDTNSIWLTGLSGTMYKYNFNYLGLQSNQQVIPLNFVLYQNYPNPFNPVTKIRFELPKSGNVKIVVSDVLGRNITNLVNQYLEAGLYETEFDASSNPSGIYFYRIETSGFVKTNKMILLK